MEAITHLQVDELVIDGPGEEPSPNDRPDQDMLDAALGLNNPEPVEQNEGTRDPPTEPPAPALQHSVTEHRPDDASSPPQSSISPQQSDFAQIEALLLAQLDKCNHYKTVFEKQDNTTLANKFETLFKLTTNDLEIVRTTWRERSQLPKFTFEAVKITCVPANVDVKEKEMLIAVKIADLPVASDAMVYCIAEFEFPLTGKEETLSQSIERWSHNVKIEPARLFSCCMPGNARQLDIIYSTDVKPFHDKNSEHLHFDRQLRFFVDKGKSRTLKRKFKPVKFTFYEKTKLLSRDKKLGTVQVKVDAINDSSTVVHRVPIMNGRKQTNALADIRIRVQAPLVDRSLRNHEEKILVLT